MRTLSPETRAKISATLKGRKRPAEVCAKIAAGHRGKTISEEHRAAISAKLTGRKAPPERHMNSRIAERVIKLFQPDAYQAKIDRAIAQMRRNYQDPAFLAKREAGQKARWERYHAAKEPTEAPADRRKRLADMNASGMSQADIARAVGLSPQRVNTLIKKHRAICADGAGMGA